MVNPDVVNKCLVPGRPPLTQKVLVAWGKDGEQAIHDNMWLLEIDENNYSSLKWKKVFSYAFIKQETIFCVSDCIPYRAKV